MTNEDKAAQARKERSTQCFYDAAYWDDYWRGRFKVKFDPDDPVNVHEAEKRLDYIERNIAEMHKMLDVGCGLGYVVAKARERDFDCCGVDISKPAIDRAPKSIQEFIQLGSITDLPYEDNEFELVTCFDILEHLFIEEIIAAVKEVSRVASRAILMRSPMSGWAGERCIVDHTYRAEDKSHVSIYPWDFWARMFASEGKFTFHLSSVFAHEEENVVDGWIVFRKKVKK